MSSLRFHYLFKDCTKTKLFNVPALVRNLSRRSNNHEGSFKPVKSRKVEKAEGHLVWRDPNFEILASPNGFPFFLPGNIGLAWYDKYTTVQSEVLFSMEEVNKEEANGNIVCEVHKCPTVLRKTVCDLFPFKNLEQCELSVVTLTLKPDLKALRQNADLETEKMAQIFVLTAKNICNKLKTAGYWADFINPFSGRPYLFPQSVDGLYQTDPKFRCLDFQIFEISECKVVSNEPDKTKKKFIGSLFSNAPVDKKRLNSIFIA
ncbi:methylmalonic aciduria and homocystinuria type D homolog, mitochondrial [Agrilus planipennis]|uniref:Methylmalonic aciduria and homocystinuria type D homolog, mitochondrial n=1 Tax=Agrilus planipennis TaxID=224129 RepID=A0A1W4WJZ2_AGRPL|nr:methylmalonic aciduria and homocystinuria type D homolog, mitochondrial [Agrilus planipennis]XP_018324242.1 methylmalonic aciduria and homocystinuria type D homolog, mitochondrial [Agrilus planipennis]XP_018324244.1 methylmalonic aciduria and homocystinuria type D homolog, mitochondrial [Agrilus planipennis]